MICVVVIALGLDFCFGWVGWFLLLDLGLGVFMGCGLYCWFALSVWVCLGILSLGYGFDLMVLSLNLDVLPFGLLFGVVLLLGLRLFVVGCISEFCVSFVYLL